eukprot:EC723013.1.p1 GENE.EC723013.1~~EC723013.1.p1  ORF type:complete len:119 (+),score=16.39 EC723013.1:32-388(+)
MSQLVAESPNKARIQQLAEKLAGLQAGLEDEKIQRIDTIEQRLSSLDDRMKAAAAHDDKKYRAMREAVAKVSESWRTSARPERHLRRAKSRSSRSLTADYSLLLKLKFKHEKMQRAVF